MNEGKQLFSATCPTCGDIWEFGQRREMHRALRGFWRRVQELAGTAEREIRKSLAAERSGK